MPLPKNKLYYTVGLPRCGKSTYCNKWVEKKPKRVIVCPDDIRQALYGQDFLMEAESMVWSMTHYQIKALLNRGFDVIVDSTNYNWNMRKQWYKIWPVVIDIPVITKPEICLQRAINTSKPDLLLVIVNMFENWDYGIPFEKDENNQRYGSAVETKQKNKLSKAGYYDKEEKLEVCNLIINEYNEAVDELGEDIEIEVEFEE